MKRFNYIVVVLVVTFFVGSSGCFGQVTGKLFTKKAANEKFGAVTNSVETPVKNLENWLNQTDKYIMFKIVNNSVIVLNQGRHVIYPEDTKVDSSDVFTVYSKSVIEDLISVGDTDSVSFEQRETVFTVTVGNVTMEVGGICPPWCPDK